MSPQFNNMNELTSYLDAMENRVKTMENQNESLKSLISDLEGKATGMLPKTRLLSSRFFQRAFAVWGHYFVAQFIIGLAFFCISLVIGLLIPGLSSYLINLYKGVPTH
jgi:hypothetical protein